MSQYRIVRDTYNGYEVQTRRWRWLPWRQKGYTNTFTTIEAARVYAQQPEVERGEIA